MTCNQLPKCCLCLDAVLLNSDCPVTQFFLVDAQLSPAHCRSGVFNWRGGINRATKTWVGGSGCEHLKFRCHVNE